MLFREYVDSLDGVVKSRYFDHLKHLGLVYLHYLKVILSVGFIIVAYTVMWDSKYSLCHTR